MIGEQEPSGFTIYITLAYQACNQHCQTRPPVWQTIALGGVGVGGSGVLRFC